MLSHFVLSTVFFNTFIVQLWGTAFPDGADSNLWEVPPNSPAGAQIMLNADMALGFNISINYNGLATHTQRCSSTGGPGGGYGCSSPSTNAYPSTYSLVNTYANDNTAFLNGFASSYAKMSTVGYGLPANTDGSTSTGKLGTLTAIDVTTCADSVGFAPFCSSTNGAPAVTTRTSMCTTYNEIVADFNAAVPTDPMLQANLFGKALRLAFHDAGKFVCNCFSSKLLCSV